MFVTYLEHANSLMGVRVSCACALCGTCLSKRGPTVALAAAKGKKLYDMYIIPI